MQRSMITIDLELEIFSLRNFVCLQFAGTFFFLFFISRCEVSYLHLLKPVYCKILAINRDTAVTVSCDKKIICDK